MTQNKYAGETRAKLDRANGATPPLIDTRERQSAIERCGGRTLAEIDSDPVALAPPATVAPYLAWLGRSTLLSALPKGGKSTLASAAAAAVSSGGMFLGERCEEGKVLWVCAEEHITDLALRLKAQGANGDNIMILPPLPNPLSDLAACAAQYEPRLLVVDVLSSFAHGLIDDARSSSTWTPVMVGLTQMTHERNCASLILGHNKKDDSDYRDSTAIGGGVDVVLVMSESKADPKVREFPKPKARWPIAPFSVRLAPNGLFELASGELSLEVRVLAAITDTPGLSKNGVRKAVSGNASEKDAMVQNLLARGLIEDRGDDTGMRLYPVPEGAEPGHTSGHTT